MACFRNISVNTLYKGDDDDDDDDKPRENSHIRHCAHTLEIADVKLQKFYPKIY
jgi:hypothetical protein